MIPLQICDGLAYFPMTPPTDIDLDIYPHIILTSDSDWDPTIMDNEIDITQINNILDNFPPTNVYDNLHFDALGNYRGTYVSNHVFTQA